ncbi:MAG: hypothetical protein NVSMB57_07480 [Actinomycetota bacterium]
MRMVAPVIFLALASAACSSGDSSTSGSKKDGGSVDSGGGKAVAIDLKGIAFSKTSVSISAGGMVTWTNRESVEHTITSGKASAPTSDFDKVLQMNDTFSYTFPKAGTYPFFCKRHPENMSGTITVS